MNSAAGLDLAEHDNVRLEPFFRTSAGGTWVLVTSSGPSKDSGESCVSTLAKYDKFKVILKKKKKKLDQTDIQED